ncbi:hypothetical protein HK102_002465 [Quaeritorhiza haematococci]|nr:hypothetical protein HK102_002465 [Quaeritorhiza haematococci]
MMIPFEIWSRVGMYLEDFKDFNNLSVPLGTPWDARTHAFCCMHQNAKEGTLGEILCPFDWVPQGFLEVLDSYGIPSKAVCIQVAIRHGYNTFLETCFETFDLCDRNSLLEDAVYSGNVAAIKFILSHMTPSDIDVYGVWSVFCMTWQWHTEQHEIVELLLMHGCDPNDSYGYLLDKLLQQNEFDLKLFALLIDHGADIGAAMPSAIRNDDVRAITQILVLSKPDISYSLQYAELRQAKKSIKFLRSIQMER